MRPIYFFLKNYSHLHFLEIHDFLALILIIMLGWAQQCYQKINNALLLHWSLNLTKLLYTITRIFVAKKIQYFIVKKLLL